MLKDNWATGEVFTATAANDVAARVNTNTARLIQVTDYGAVGDNSTDNTTAFSDAVTAAASSTGSATVWVPPGVYRHTGISLAAGVTLMGAGIGKTTLRNTHASNTSVSLHGTAGGPYIPGATLQDCTIDATAVHSGQAGVDALLAFQFTVRHIEVSGHGVGVQHRAAWECLYHDVHVHDCTTGWYIPPPGTFSASTPVTWVGCHAVDCTTGFQVDDGVSAGTWTGGDFSRCTTGIVLDGTQTGGVVFDGLNFEGISGDDVQIGPTAGPAGIVLNGCRFFYPTTKARSIYFKTGDQVTLNGCKWVNSTKIARLDNGSGSIVFTGCGAGSYTTFLDVNGTTSDVSPILIGSVTNGIRQVGVPNEKLTTPKIATSIKDTNGNTIFELGATASAANYFGTFNQVAGGGPGLYVNGSDTNIDFAISTKGTGKFYVNGVLAADVSAAQTFTNKRVTPRVTTINAPGATPTVATDSWDQINYTGLAAAITSMTTNLTGTPTDGQRLCIRLKDNGTARAVTWGASFVAGPAALLTTTVAGKTHFNEFVYDSAAAKWACTLTHTAGY